MGRRNINTTKSGKYMNPTDQARKEARKKELKKNKRQRMAVRAAVLKGKDPTQLIVEMEKMDQMEYNVEIPPALSEKVLKDKRKKLRETLDRVLKLYEKENPEYWVEIRRMVADYEKKRQTLIEHYEAVKHAQAVTLDEISLPNFDMPTEGDGEDFDGIEISGHLMPGAIHDPMEDIPQPHSILKKHSLPHEMMPPPVVQVPVEVKAPPGCPPMLPPDLSDDEDTAMDTEHAPKQRKIRFEDEQHDRQLSDDERGEDDGGRAHVRHSRKRDDRGGDSDEEMYGDRRSESASLPKSQGLTSLQAKLLQLSGQDVDQFVKQSEVLLQEKEADKRAELRERLSKLDKEQGRRSDRPSLSSSVLLDSSSLDASLPPGESAPTRPSAPPPAPFNIAPPSVVPPPVGVPPVGGPPTPVPPVGMHNIPMYRPPPPRPGMPPPHMGIRLPPGPPPQNLLPQGMPRMPNMRLPPPMRPPGMMGPPGGMMPPRPTSGAAPNVLSAGPQLVPRPARHAPSAPTIQAKPQIRSLSADVTRFLPTALRVKREDKKKQNKQTPDGKETAGRPQGADVKPTKDDAYSQFMREMEDLL